MKFFVKIIIQVIIVLFVGISISSAQNTLLVSKKSNAQTPYGLSLINTITFSNGAMYVNKYNGSSDIYAVSNISSMNFTIATAKKMDLDKVKPKEFILFPNPVCDELTLNFPTSESKNIQLNIFDTQGRCVFQKRFNNQQIATTINLSQLPKGLYICRFHDGETIEVNKFIKQ